MNLIIIREDNLVTIDGRSLTVDCTTLPVDLHAVQWSGTSGHVERPGLQNQTIDSIGDFITQINGWLAAADAIDNPPPPDLETLKAAKNAEINAARAAANSSTFTHDGHLFACDALSRSDIDGITGYVALNDAFPPAFPGAWKAIDNSYYPMPDVAAWKAFLAAMVATGSANFAHAQLLKQALAAATTPEEVAAISWTNE